MFCFTKLSFKIGYYPSRKERIAEEVLTCEKHGNRFENSKIFSRQETFLIKTYY